MDRKYLNNIRYSWEKDERHFKVDGSIVAGRCFICARTFLHAAFGISLCRNCDEAMSNCRDGPRHDYDSFLNAKDALARRDLREPLDFDFEEKLKQAQQDNKLEPNFKLANNKPIFVSTGNEEEDERIRRLYEL